MPENNKNKQRVPLRDGYDRSRGNHGRINPGRAPEINPDNVPQPSRVKIPQ